MYLVYVFGTSSSFQQIYIGAFTRVKYTRVPSRKGNRLQLELKLNLSHGRANRRTRRNRCVKRIFRRECLKQTRLLSGYCLSFIIASGRALETRRNVVGKASRRCFCTVESRCNTSCRNHRANEPQNTAAWAEKIGRRW